MNKQVRKQVYDKFSGHCAYCGREIRMDQMQVDHIVPKIACGTTDDIDNFNPACRTCNNWKHSNTIEHFRSDLQQQVRRAREYSTNFRMAERYGLVQAIEKPVSFYFERHKLIFNNPEEDCKEIIIEHLKSPGYMEGGLI